MSAGLLTRLLPPDGDDALPEVRRESPGPVRRLRLGIVMLSLALLVFAQSAGNTAADTKIDLVVSPWRFLSRALRLWDPVGGAGQLQNQAYGYLFPMGPFFGALHGIDVPPWEIQRLWQSALVIGAFLGAYLLSAHFGVDGFWPRVATGLCYALAPRMISELSTISAELMPVAALPWVLLPLVSGAASGSPRRSAARSGIALLFAGGVNAAATLAILPVPGLWLLTRRRGPRRRALIGWWCVAIALACAWWAIPLVLLGSYSPPFLDWIESSSTTTLPTSLSSSLRGVDHWESFLGPGVWPGGWIFASAPATIVATAALSGLGLAGLSRRAQPHRGFLFAALLLGLVLVTAGHLAEVGPPGAGTVQQWLDGPLVAFRNVHKFDPLIRLPLAIGLGALMTSVRLPAWYSVRVFAARLSLPVRALAAGCLIALAAVAVTPMLSNQSVVSPRVTTEPGWWASAATWLAQHSDGRRALLLPGSASPAYLWGATVDTALQPVATTPWTVRDAVPLSQAGYIRFLDAVSDILAAGQPDPTLAPLLARAGIAYLVVANDLNSVRSGAPPSMLLHATLDGSPGIALQASFGPVVGSGSPAPNNLLDGGASRGRPSVQIYRVAGAPGPVSLEPLSSALHANGSSEALVPLVRSGLAADAAVFFGSDGATLQTPQAPTVQAQTVLTDGIRKRQASFGNSATKSATMTAAMPYSGRRAAYDYLPDGAGGLSAFSYQGIADVTASSAGSDVSAYFNRSAANSPFAAIDGDPATAWRSGSPSGSVGQWLQVSFSEPRSMTSVKLRFTDAGRSGPTSIAVRTDSGVTVSRTRPDQSLQNVAVPAGQTRSLRITIASVADNTFGSTIGISTLQIPGLQPRRFLRVPGMSDASSLVFSVPTGSRSACISVAGRPVCDSSYEVAGEEDAGLYRAFELAGEHRYQLDPTVTLQAGAALDRYLAAGSAIKVLASSTNPGDPRSSAISVVDGSPTTSWQAGRGDVQPKLTLRLAKPSTISALRILSDPAAAAAVPREVSVTAGTQRWHGTLPADGRITLDKPVRTAAVTITITSSSLRQSTSSLNYRTSLLPVAISEIELSGPAGTLPATQLPSMIDIGCGAGLWLDIDGKPIGLAVTARRADVLAGLPVRAKTCPVRSVDLTAGEHTMSLPSTPLARAVSILATSTPSPLGAPAAASGTMSVQRWDSTDRAVAVSTTAASVLVVRENTNSGWHARLNGRELAAVRVDGWQQGFAVPAGAHGTIELTFAPQRPFVIGLVIGVAGVLLLLAIAALPGRRGAQLLEPLGDARLPWVVAISLLAVAATLLAGLWGTAVVVVVFGFAQLIERMGLTLPAWVPAVLILIPGLMQAQANAFQLFTVANSATSQLLCVAALVIGAVGSGGPVGSGAGAGSGDALGRRQEAEA
jgi:arabinofuranan 3-O-arabinosyltransferase